MAPPYSAWFSEKLESLTISKELFCFTQHKICLQFLFSSDLLENHWMHVTNDYMLHHNQIVPASVFQLTKISKYHAKNSFNASTSATLILLESFKFAHVKCKHRENNRNSNPEKATQHFFSWAYDKGNKYRFAVAYIKTSCTLSS